MEGLMGYQGMAPAQALGADVPMVDTAETIAISSLALLKMLKHGRAGVPMEVNQSLLRGAHGREG
jgi:26S proteasome regulatory subunit N11